MIKESFQLLLITIASLTMFSCSLEAPTCTPGEIECHGAVYSECVRSGAAWDEIICNTPDNPKPFCHVEQICVECNDDSDCQSLEKHCVDHACEPLSVAACIDGAKTCKNSKLYTCRKKAWETPVICPEACNDEGTA